MRTQKEKLEIKWKREVKRDASIGTKQKYILRWAKKIKAIEYKGGKCSKCNENRPYVLSFHHISEKGDAITDMITRQRRWSEIKKELDKCDLLCENCHRNIHAESDKIGEFYDNNKNVFLKLKNSISCNLCGYNECKKSLDFHHEHGEKEFKITKYVSSIKSISVQDVEDFVVEEVNKCEVLCANCHKEKHFNIEKFNSYKLEIEEKLLGIKEKNKQVSKDEVLLFKESGLSIKEISKKIGCSYARVYEILKTYGFHCPDEKTKKKIILLFESGKNIIDIAREVGCERQSIPWILKEHKKGLL